MKMETTPKVNLKKQSHLMTVDHKLNLTRVHNANPERTYAGSKYQTISDHKKLQPVDEPYNTFDYNMNVQDEYQSQFTVQDPHMVFYKQCRERNRDKELHGPMKLGAKSQSSYERIKKELKSRGAIPIGNKHQQSPWEVIATTKAALVETLNKAPSQVSLASVHSGPYENFKGIDSISYASSYMSLPKD